MIEKNDVMHDQFLTAFNRLQSTMAEVLGMSPNTDFSNLIQKGDKEHPMIDYYSDDLNFIRQVRNLLVHENKAQDDTYLKIQPPLVKLVEQLTEVIAHPMQVKNIIKNNAEVVTFHETAPLTDVLDEIKRHRYSQFPIFNRTNLISVLTENSITRFLADNIHDDGTLTIRNVRVKDLLGEADIDKRSRSFEVVTLDESIYTVSQLFLRRLKRGETTFIVIVGETRNIQKPEDIEGIITPYDLPVLAGMQGERRE